MLLLPAQMLDRQGPAEAGEMPVDVLVRAQQEAEALGSTRSLWRILAIRARIEERVGDLEAAARDRDLAAQIVRQIARSLPERLRRPYF